MNSPLGSTARQRETAVARGRRCEALAERYLTDLGYRVTTRNYRCTGGEIDLIAFEANVLCFVEVRARSNDAYGTPLETLNRRKIRRIVCAARNFLEHIKGPWPPMRFDALGILLLQPPEFTLIRGAFEA